MQKKEMIQSLLLTLLIFFVPFTAFSKTQVIDRLQASINDDIVLLSDISHFRKTLSLRKQIDPLFIDSPLSKQTQLSDAEILEYLIQEKTITVYFPVVDEEVEQEIRSIESKNRIDRKTLMTALSQQGVIFDDYFELIRSSIAKRKLIDRDIRTRVFISDDDIKNYYYNTVSKKDVSYAYNLKMITITPSHFSSPQVARDTAKEALNAIKAGKSFEEVAKKYSDAPSATNGGDIGFFSESEMSPIIKKEVKKLKPGQVSEVLGTSETHFFIIKIAGLRSNRDQQYEKDKENYRLQLASQEYRRQVDLWLERKKTEAFVHVPKYE